MGTSPRWAQVPGENPRWKLETHLGDKALRVIAARLRELKEKESPASLAVVAGDELAMAGQVSWDVISRFCHVYGRGDILVLVISAVTLDFWPAW